jgi:hypothetical protein
VTVSGAQSCGRFDRRRREAHERSSLHGLFTRSARALAQPALEGCCTCLQTRCEVQRAQTRQSVVRLSRAACAPHRPPLGAFRLRAKRLKGTRVTSHSGRPEPSAAGNGRARHCAPTLEPHCVAHVPREYSCSVQSNRPEVNASTKMGRACEKATPRASLPLPSAAPATHSRRKCAVPARPVP